jgi:hypothetical protein
MKEVMTIVTIVGKSCNETMLCFPIVQLYPIAQKEEM